MGPDLRWEVSASDRKRPPVTGANGTLMARRSRGAGFPALVQGRSCRVRVGRRVVERQGRRAHRRGVRGGSPGGSSSRRRPPSG